MMDPFSDEPGPNYPRPGEPGPRRDPEYIADSDSGEGWGCLGVLLILLGIPPILLGLFFGMCWVQFPVGEFFLIAFVCFGVGGGLIAAGRRLCSGPSLMDDNSGAVPND